MVQFHWNPRLLHPKTITLIFITSFLVFIPIFEITYHLWNTCTLEEPIDVVYTWVNGSDPLFLKELREYLGKYGKGEIDSSGQRYDDKNELKYSLRSLEKYAPWINHVYVVTNGQIPSWLNLDYDRVTLVTHKEIFDDSYNTPTFSSPAIEMHLHRIPNLSKRFIYFNDDIFLHSPVYKEDFYSSSRGFLIYLSWLVPMCSPGCYWLYVADGHCDEACNNLKCQQDGGDCDNSSRTLLGDVIVKFDDYEMQETNYEKVLSHLNKTVGQKNVSDAVDEHNRRVLLLDKLKRRKIRKKFVSKLVNFVDAYAESLQHTNRILNENYGFSVRKVPAHAPILIDREVMEKLRKKFAKFFNKTARNRFRSVDDVQFSFIYYYFLIHEKINPTVGEIFDRFDTDESGVWSDLEIRTVVAKSYDLPITEEAFSHFTNLLVNCSSLKLLPYLQVTKNFVENCLPLSVFLKLNFGLKHEYKFDIIKDSEKKHVWFKMLNSNVSEVINQLDEIRKSEKKFVCLNDNLDQSRASDNQVIKRLMEDFYSSLFPLPSKFELGVNYRNKFLYMDDYLDLMGQQNRRFVFVCLVTSVIIFSLFVRFFRRKLLEVLFN